ncbi:hypothetical protein BRC81_03395 [Halobacteriales archaeon QS_1_68_20]|nr:MAG: hypothetical protein BRC81_03395 [Halobacteriales archaeon QS_1_68_20]
MVTLALLYALRRLVVVVWRFLPLLVGYARDRRRFLLFGGRRQLTREQRRQRAERLLDALLALGPTFIKLGQLLSTRPDVLPPVYVDVLARLQDRVPPADWEDARQVLENEVGPVEEAFEEFDTEAISGASLGQVYLASHEGEQVAVKVRRPGVEQLVETDLQVIRWTLPVILYFVDDARSFSLSNLADEFATTIRQEMDYEREAGVLREIRNNFTGEDGVTMPRVIDERSGKTVLTMEYVAGTKITDVEALDEQGIDRTALAERLQRTYLQMIVEDGVFHADPHPGNLSVRPDGTLVFYDFGMSGRVEDSVQRNIVEFYLAVADRDIDAILDVLERMGTLSPEADRDLMSEVMELAIRDARGEAVEQYRVQQIVRQVEGTMYEFPLRLPRNLALVLRVATVVEGVCVTLDPEFDFIDVATSYLAEQGYREEGVRMAISGARENVTEAARSSVRIPPKFERTLDRIDRENFRVEAAVVDPENHVDRLGRRIAYSILLSAGALTTALVYIGEGLEPAAVPGALSAFMAVLLYRTLRRRRTLSPKPQFTRQGLRQRRGEE